MATGTVEYDDPQLTPTWMRDLYVDFVEPVEDETYCDIDLDFEDDRLARHDRES